MVLVFYISGHGFGHAARSVQVINAVSRLSRDSQFVVRTTVPEWFLRRSLDATVHIVPGETDTGVVQPDGLTIDEAETARRAAAFYADFAERVEREAAFLRECRAALVVADIPPVALAAAAAVGVPSVAFGNFTWDWIYGGFPGFDDDAPGVRGLIAKGNAQATLALRLPFSGGFDAMPCVRDVPLVARRAALARAEVRKRLDLLSDRPVVLATFGGHGGNIPLARAAGNRSFLLVATDYEVGSAQAHPNLRVVSGAEMHSAGVGYTDLVAACDVVATKLGYGIVSECLANEVPLLYARRGRFIEQDVFIREMPAVMRSREIAADDLREGRWTDAVDALLAQPAPVQRVGLDGDDAAARQLLTRLER